MAATDVEELQLLGSSPGKAAREEDGRGEPRAGFLGHPAAGAPGQGKGSEGATSATQIASPGPTGPSRSRASPESPRRTACPSKAAHGRCIAPDAGAESAAPPGRWRSLVARTGFDGESA